MAKTKTEVECDNCGHTWKTVRRRETFCPRCGVVNDVPGPEVETITLPSGTVLAVGDECLAGYPLSLRYRRATIIGVIQEVGEHYARVRDMQGNEWEVIRHGLKQYRS